MTLHAVNYEMTLNLPIKAYGAIEGTWGYFSIFCLELHINHFSSQCFKNV